MALSNIFREPRREITESIVGILALAAFGWLDWKYAEWLCRDDIRCHERPDLYALGMILGAALAIAIFIIVVFTHFLGDQICAALQRGGIHLRPRNRP